MILLRRQWRLHREVSESSHDIVMGESMSSDVSAMDLDRLDVPAQSADAEGRTEQQTAEAVDQPGMSAASSTSVPCPGYFWQPKCQFDFWQLNGCHVSTPVRLARAQVPKSTWMVRNSTISVLIPVK